MKALSVLQMECNGFWLHVDPRITALSPFSFGIRGPQTTLCFVPPSMSFLFSKEYYEVNKKGISPFQTMVAYLGGSAFQTIGDNPITAYRQLVQQYAKGLDGKAVDPKVAASEANAVFRAAPVSASLSGLVPRLIGAS